MSLTAAWVSGMMTSLEPTAPWRASYDRTAGAIAKVADAEPLFDGDAPRTAALLVSGRCDRGLPESRYRMFLARQLRAKHPVPKDDKVAKDGGAKTASR